MFRPVGKAWPDSRPQPLRQYCTVGAEHPAKILTLDRVPETDLPSTIRAVQCGRPVAPEKLARHYMNCRKGIRQGAVTAQGAVTCLTSVCSGAPGAPVAPSGSISIASSCTPTFPICEKTGFDDHGKSRGQSPAAVDRHAASGDVSRGAEREAPLPASDRAGTARTEARVLELFRNLE